MIDIMNTVIMSSQNYPCSRLLRVDLLSIVFALLVVGPFIGLLLVLSSSALSQHRGVLVIGHLIYYILLLFLFRFFVRISHHDLLRVGLQSVAAMSIVSFLSTMELSRLVEYQFVLWLSALFSALYYLVGTGILIAGLVYLLYEGGRVVRILTIFLVGVCAGLLSSIEVLYRWSLSPLTDVEFALFVAGVSAVLYYYAIAEWDDLTPKPTGVSMLLSCGITLAALQFLAGITRMTAGAPNANTMEVVLLNVGTNLVFFVLLYLAFRFLVRPQQAHS